MEQIVVETDKAQLVPALASATDAGRLPVGVSDVSASHMCCMLCRRKFKTIEALTRHEALSQLHVANVRAEQLKRSECP